MGASIEDYLEIYKQACTAYAQQNYDVAATLVDQVVQNLPDDPNSHLLRGHIYYVLQQYDIAKAEYQKVLQLTDNKEIIGFAKHGIESINQYQGNSSDRLVTPENYQQISTEDLAHSTTDLNTNSFDNKAFDEYEAVVNEIEELSLDSPFNISANSSTDLNSQSDSAASFSDDPFKLDNQATDQDSQSKSWEAEADLELPAFWQEDETENSIEQSSTSNPFVDSGTNSQQENDSDSSFAEVDLSTSNSWEIPTEFLIGEQYNPPEDLDFNSNSLENENFAKIPTSVRDNGVKTNNLPSSHHEQLAETTSHNWLGPIEAEDSLKEVSAASRDLPPEEKLAQKGVKVEASNLDLDDNFDLDAFESAFGSDSFTPDEEPVNQPQASNSQSNIEFLDEFDDFDDLGNLPGFDISDADSSFSDVAMHSGSFDMASNSDSHSAEPSISNENSDREDELFSITGSQEAMPIFTQVDVAKLEPVVSVEQSWLAPLENAPLEKKQWLIAGSVGIVSSLVVAIVSFGATNFSPPQQRESVRNTGWAMSLAAGLAGFATAAFMGNFTIKQIRRTTENLQAQFDAVRQGNLNVQATVYSEDELGLLATGFNEMARVIFTTTNEAQRKADEQEEAKENLQRQVIRLLDDVEGAARGDLTVQAEVTADVLGAVADAFNLTIQNLRDIVQQVKVAAKEVTKGATNSETFARALSSDALRQAEELAVTLNSVQVMTDSIQRVAEAAREAEAVARDASTIALKGGEAVENTVAGILEIRETVAETTRKVKRLAESSQEISKIVALISQIASRTNLLALNASIEAARAGEAGRGFAIVADEVRQLADKSAKSLKEIEQIVMQIQSETGSVMTAMEEGTQQVIKGTKLAEEAKRSLENIIQVANRIDILVRSITSDTVEQTETSRAVAHVMQSVELTAQETSQEAQRVSGALQNLVGVSRDLIASVERFRVETLESR
ncbi:MULTISPECIES: methyl-accepting chemotaxis protein [Calothrix]|uniref:HAMP domain-containing protein n=2 Tax=Calothrix TaxID=1186 RepID=A0ABR8AD17_9CYAN|nr:MULTISPECIES: methyl-accepting chemotaxis protein [Calothrix]MBD2197900.1 HAMP domain-containing protein [Calothrix parietina FACHB-288]MBD2226304.1 HAMP domain-containing protein [Calothrix anomala FACHB-343]